MDTPVRREVLVAAIASSLAAVPFAYAFAHTELARWWRDRPGALVTLFAVGLVLAVAGAVLSRYLKLPRLSASSQLGHAVHGAIFGILFGLVAGAIGWLAADTTLWVLLMWFFLGALLLSGARAVLPRHVRRDG